MFGRLKEWIALKKLSGADRKTIFAHHYRTNFWGDQESLSGPGSSLKYTENLRAHLPGLLSDLGVKTFLDAPCGDFNWMRMVELPEGVQYHGCDIVPELVDRLQKEYGDDRRRFSVLDIVDDEIPRADLWMCRDVLFHLNNREVFRVLKKFADSEIPWLLTTSHRQGKNQDTTTGGFRLLNLEAAPFGLPPAERYIADSIDGFPDRCIGLWSNAALKTWVQFQGEV